jgi:hypothetical protein
MGQVYAGQPLVGYDYWQNIKAPVAEPLFVRIGQQPDAVSGHKCQGWYGSK